MVGVVSQTAAVQCQRDFWVVTHLIHIRGSVSAVNLSIAIPVAAKLNSEDLNQTEVC